MSWDHTISWFEIPVSNIDRATRFYNELLAVKMAPEAYGPTKMSVFPIEGKGVHGALVQGDGYTPGSNGTLVYFNAGEDLSPALARVEKAGGKVVQPKMAIGEHGFMAIFTDTEGNRLALHSPK
jgi:uncharacterized protein